MTDRTVLAVFFATIALGGSNAVAIRVGNAELAPFWNATLRFAIAAVLFLVVAAFVRPPLPRGRTLLGVVLYGLLSFVGTYAFAYAALANAPASVGAMMIALAPLFTFGFAIAHRLERFRWEGLLGSLLALSGVAIVSAEQLGAAVPLTSLLAAVAAAVCMAESNVLAKLVPPGHPVTANLFGMAIGAVVIAPLSLALGEPWTLPTEPRTWTALLYIGSVGSVLLFLAYLFVLRRWSATATSYVLLLMPLWSTAAGVVVLGESVSGIFALGAALILGGTYVGAFLKRKPKHAPICQPPECVPAAAAKAAAA